jgi:uncharacterized DUF497 family protein
MAIFIFNEYLSLFLSSDTFDFEWDEGNSVKNYLKHGLSTRVIESIFRDQSLTLLGKQIFPVVSEERFAVIGRSLENNLVFAVFTIRRNQIRIISARKANKKERKFYE